MKLERGMRLLDRYVLEEQIGAGGMASIMTARDERTGKTVAIKQLVIEEGSDGDKQRAWFKREVRAMMVLDHPGIPRLLDHGPMDDADPYIVIEYLRGFDLEQALLRHGPLPESATVALAVKLLAALEAAHGVDIVHRDIKPANMFLCFTGRAVLLDFGLARATSTFFGQTLARGNSTQLAGTPQYFSPEQVTGEAKLSPPSDLFSLGASLYHLLSGRGPFDGGGLMDVLGAIRENRRRPLSSSAHWLKPETVAFVEGLLAPNPAERPTAGAALARAEDLLRTFPDGEVTLRRYAQAFERDEKPPAPTVAGTMDAIPVPETAVTPLAEQTVIAPEQHTVIATAQMAPARRSMLPYLAVAITTLALVAVVVTWRMRRPPPPKPPVVERAALPASLPMPEPVAVEVPKTPPPVPPPPNEPKRPAAPAQGTLALRLRQWAVVSVDGQSYGRKQIMMTLPLSEGRHEVEATNERYGSRIMRVVIKKNQETAVEVDFTREN